MEIKRAQVWWADLGEPIGSGPGHLRPVVVVQDNALNESRIRTLICVTMTTNLALDTAPGNILITPGESKLPKPSVINVSQIYTLDRSQLIEFVSNLSSSMENRLNDGLRLALGL
jgi:mRNA interferase MazF